MEKSLRYEVFKLQTLFDISTRLKHTTFKIRIKLLAASLILAAVESTVTAQPSPAQSPSIYLAGPLGFSEVGREFKDRVLIPQITSLGYRVIDPFTLTPQSKFAAIDGLRTLEEKREAWRRLNAEIGRTNQSAIDSSDVVIAVLDGTDVDSGTASEIGYAFDRRKPILGYRGDFRLAADNLGSTVNLQVEHFIDASGGEIVAGTAQIPEALSRLLKEKLASARPQPPPATQMAQKRTAPTAQRSGEFLDLVNFFQRAFTVVLALALGEAFKQFVVDKAHRVEDPVMQWDRTPALLAFLLLILPFFQGMSRYFFVTYEDSAKGLPNHYDLYLMFDGLVFMAESALFFIMSRALSAMKWRTFYWTVVALLGLDSIWGSIAMSHGASVLPWIVSNTIFGLILLPILLRHKNDNWAPQLGLFVILIRTLADYYSSWSFYFPAT
jgi:nucleoside 2-deoxyribosyltransferase